MKEIQLSRSNFSRVPKLSTLVDDEDYEELSKRWWHAVPHRKTYIVMSTGGLIMARVIMKPPSDLEADHKDLNGLNNQKSNLRICTTRQNCQNRSNRSDGESEYKGVGWHYKGWRARITTIYGRISLGVFKTQEEAAREYDRAALLYFGEFAKLNFPEGKEVPQGEQSIGSV